MKNVSQQDWIAAIAATENAVIIDVRTPEECATGILENAIMLDFFRSESFKNVRLEFLKMQSCSTFLGRNLFNMKLHNWIKASLTLCIVEVAIEVVMRVL